MPNRYHLTPFVPAYSGRRFGHGNAKNTLDTGAMANKIHRDRPHRSTHNKPEWTMLSGGCFRADVSGRMFQGGGQGADLSP